MEVRSGDFFGDDIKDIFAATCSSFPSDLIARSTSSFYTRVRGRSFVYAYGVRGRQVLPVRISSPCPPSALDLGEFNYMDENRGVIITFFPFSLTYYILINYFMAHDD
jgi:hypothetical protein